MYLYKSNGVRLFWENSTDNKDFKTKAVGNFKVNIRRDYKFL